MFEGRKLPLIVLEGLSGTGKSMLAPRLAEAIGAEFVPSIPAELSVARSAIDQQTNVEARHLFYLTALAMTSSLIAPRIVAGERILLESYYDRAQAFHIGMGSSVRLDTAFMVQPDLVIVLDCNEDVRRQRLADRDRSGYSYWRDRAEQHTAAIRAYYDTLPRAVHIDSNNAIYRLLALTREAIEAAVYA